MMASALSAPSFLLACIDSYQEGTRIPSLLTERRAVAKQLESAETAGVCQIIQEDVSPKTNFIHLLEKHSFKEPITVLHLCGMYKGGDEWDIPTLSATMGKFPELQLVFLNGCANLPLIEMLLLKDIPAVIATQSRVSEEMYLHLAKIFYEALAKGLSIRDAFWATQNQFPGQLARMQASYSLEEDCLLWENSPEDGKAFKAGIYVLEENLSRLLWKLDIRQEEMTVEKEAIPENEFVEIEVAKLDEQTADEGKADAKIPVKPKPSKRLLTITIVFFLCLLTSGAILMSLHRNVSQQDQWINEQLPPIKDDLFKLVVLPFNHYRDCEKPVGKFTDAIFSQLKNIESEIDHFAVNYGKYVDCDAHNLAERLLKEKRAQMVIWGNFHTDEAGDSLISLYYGYLHINQEVHFTQLAAHQLAGLIEPQPDGRHSYIQAISMQAMGIAAYRQKNYEASISLLETSAQAGIDDKSIDSMLAIAHNRRGTRFVQDKQEDKAWFHFSQALHYDSSLAEAYYNRGLINLKFERMDDAISDMKEVLRLSPSGGKPYGALAAIYASRGEEEEFYNYLERSLEAGINIQQYIQYTAIKNYESKDRFQKLLMKYDVQSVR